MGSSLSMVCFFLLALGSPVASSSDDLLLFLFPIKLSLGTRYMSYSLVARVGQVAVAQGLNSQWQAPMHNTAQNVCLVGAQVSLIPQHSPQSFHPPWSL